MFERRALSVVPVFAILELAAGAHDATLVAWNLGPGRKLAPIAPAHNYKTYGGDQPGFT